MDTPQDNQFPTSDPVVAEALKRFKSCESHGGKTRQLAAKCHNFFVGGEKQWEDNVLSSYRAQKRPDLTFNGLPQFVYNVLNEQLQNPSEIEVSPDGMDAHDKLAQILQDQMRKIRTCKQGQYAINHGFRDDIIGGFGYFRICTDYVNDQSFNQYAYLEPIDSCFSVYFDPGATFPTYRDARFCILFQDIPLEQFRAEYPNARTMGVSGIDGNENDWLGKDSIRVMEYIRRVEKKRTIVQLADGSTADLKDVPEGASIIHQREVCEYTVTCYKMTAFEQLDEPKVWAGKYIPIIPIMGEQVIVDGERHIKGLLHDAIDPAIAGNFMKNEQLLNISTAAKAPYLVAEGQIDNAEDKWEEANRKAWAFLPYKRYDEEGRDLGEPIRNNTEPPVQAVQLAINSLDLALQQSMGIYPNALGQQQGLDESARAVIERKKSSQYGNFRFTNELNIALQWLGEQLIDLIPKVYDAPQILALEGLDKKPYKVGVYNSQTQGADVPMLQGVEEVFDLSTGTYSITVSTGPGYETQRQECQAFFAAFAQAAPELVPRFADLWARSMDFPEKDELADRLMPPDVAQAQGNAGAQLPALQAQMQQKDQMIQHLSQMVNQLVAEKQGKVTEIHGRAAIEAMKLKSEERRDSMKNVTDLAIQASESHQKNAQTILDHEIGRIQKNMDMDHEIHMSMFTGQPVMPDEEGQSQQ